MGLELAKVSKRLVEHNLQLNTTEEASKFLAKEGYDPEYGARPLRRVIQKRVEDPLADVMLTSFQDEGEILVDFDVDKEEITVQFLPLRTAQITENRDKGTEIEPEIIPAG